MALSFLGRANPGRGSSSKSQEREESVQTLTKTVDTLKQRLFPPKSSGNKMVEKTHMTSSHVLGEKTHWHRTMGEEIPHQSKQNVCAVA